MSRPAGGDGARAGIIPDISSGGAIALAIAHERPRASVLATDISADALDVARDNALSLELANVEFARADWYDGIAQPGLASGGFDLIVSNPPYVAAGESWRVVPDASAHLLFVAWGSAAGGWTREPSLRLVGARSQYVDTDPTGRTMMLGLRLRPGVLSSPRRVSGDCRGA